MKIGWHLVTKRDDFWVKVLRSKYSCGSDVLPKIDMRKPRSNLWSGIKRTWNTVQEGIEELPQEQVRWKWSKNGTFSDKSAYDTITQDGALPNPMWSKIWKLKIPERCKMFLWLVLHQRILTNASRCKRGLCGDDGCQVCGMASETLLHLLRDCSDTHGLWQQIVPSKFQGKFFSMHLDQWLSWNLNSRGDNQSREEWRKRFVITCWWLWRRRNTLVFEGKVISNHTIISSMSAMIGTMNEARNKLCTIAARRLHQSEHEDKWRPPLTSWVKVNSDGAYSALSPGVASGGILRNDRDELLSAFMFKGDDGDSLTAELWGCLHGIKLAWDLGARNVILEVDAAEVVTLLKIPVSNIHEDSRLITEIQSVLDREWKVEVQLISRWANSATDRLAKLSLSAMPGLHLVQAADDVLERIFILDKA